MLSATVLLPACVMLEILPAVLLQKTVSMFPMLQALR